MWKLALVCTLGFVIKISSGRGAGSGRLAGRGAGSGRGAGNGRGAGRMQGRGVASLGSRQRGAIRRFLAALTGDEDAGR